MKSQQNPEAANDQQPTTRSPSSAVEFIAVLTVLIFVVCTAASLLLATPASLQAAASTPPELANSGKVPERPFHERYPVNAVADPVNPPTF